jgi:hypothetical protein
VSAWAKNLTMIVVLTVWAAVVGAYLIQDELPDAPLLGIPAALIIALYPPFGRNRRPPDDEEPRT